MECQHLKSSSVVVRDDVSVLCNPWLLDGAFYGAWAHYLPLQFEPEDYNDVDYNHKEPDVYERPLYYAMSFFYTSA